ncbi:Eco57I restriction-modification methylase domain-containing protein [Prosthecochloris vibrioformis]|uniref:site-specific DNA-methyltransferase (adenine-specific) n=1 Tax=Prosthecochloris vibrioformis TaxID=1098 RepID=A0A5C4RXC3_PROVB|nr:Eco57I restriction-modification methylase domain-containing protein [Prosthecochloris vibrioformis]TNJ35936.1 class I SAM-dependent DNA methyltransferase [Prosthecochloris vibrioformis]
MDKQQAQELIEKLFTTAFDRDSYQHFLRNLLNNYEPRDAHYTGNYIPDAFKQHINQYWRIGKYVDPEDEELDLLVVEVKSLTKLERARSSLRNFAISRLKQFEKESSLIAFYAHDDNGADWRFSFVKIDHEAYRDDKGKVRLKQELTPAKRYSYLVGVHENSHTASKQLLPILMMDYADPRIDEIERAFSIERVTSEFFDQYKALFQHLAEHLKTQPWFRRENDDASVQAVSRFAKKLLGQIVFLYFLQKKGWLGASKSESWGKGSRRFLWQRFQEVTRSGKNYYRDFLRYLFYDALANERKDQNDSGYYSRFDCRVPFLNGGLFEAEPGYDWQNDDIEIPDRLFHNGEKTKGGDTGTGILDVFERYNFTIKEDEPLDKEVAVDPEMLGKVFENMLEITERKSKGAFYTPREIVHYMCQESLIIYLDNCLNSFPESHEEIGSSQISMYGNEGLTGQLKMTATHQHIRIPKEHIETLIREGHLALENDTRVINKGRETDTYKFKLPESVRTHALAIDSALADITVCDPAIGSGAFPVGLLHEIVSARLALAPHSGINHSAYELKRHAIANSIYGVDIDASAIDIARLRLWLSLIVDEEDYDRIEPLPNLDYKIVRGDSLIGFPDGVIKDDKACKRLESIKSEFYNETDQQKRKALREQIADPLQVYLQQAEQYTGYVIDFDFELFFSEVWHEKDGFDVVIGNPPYVQIQKFSGQQVQKEWETQKYETFAKTGDIYCLFYEKGHRLLRKHGILAFITSNKWMRAAYGEKLRRFFSQKTQPRTLIDFSSFQVFDSATVDTNVLIFTKEDRSKPVRACLINHDFTRSTPLDAFTEKHSIQLDDVSAESWVISDQAHFAIKKQIEAVGFPLKDWDVAIYRGILTGFNEAFIIDGKKKDELISQDTKSAEIIKPIVRGRDIKRYSVDFSDLWLVATFPALDLNIDDYPAVSEYLRTYGRKLYQTGEIIGKDENGSVIKSRKKTGNNWFETQDQISYYKEFEKAKIVWLEMSPRPNYAYSDAPLFVLNTSYILTGKKLKWLLAVLNSEIMDFYFPLISTDVRGKTRRYIKQYVELLPVVPYTHSHAAFLELFVDFIKEVKFNKLHLQAAFFEQLIDGLVYELYFPEELIASGKDISQHIGELNPITDQMSEEEKLAVI